MFEFPKVPVEKLNEKREFPVFPKGEYYFRIESADEGVSQAGNPMLVLILVVSNDHGETVKVWDYLVNDEKMAWKFHHLCKAIKREELYIEGRVNKKSLEGKGGRVKLGISHSSGYAPKNKVVDYISNDVQNNANEESPMTENDAPWN